MIVDYEFFVNEYDKFVYFKVMNNGYVILCLYVGDILIFGAKLEYIIVVKSYLSRKFDMKDLGEADTTLDMKISGTLKGNTLNLSHSIEKILEKFDFLKLFSLSSPYESLKMLKKNEGGPLSQLRYYQLIGSLLYVSN